MLWQWSGKGSRWNSGCGGDSSNSGDAATYIMDDTSDTVDAAVDGVEEIGGTDDKGRRSTGGTDSGRYIIRYGQNSGIPGQR